MSPPLLYGSNADIIQSQLQSDVNLYLTRLLHQNSSNDRQHEFARFLSCMTELSSGACVRCHAKHSSHTTPRWDVHGQRLVQCHWNSSRRAVFSSWTRHIPPGCLRLPRETKLSCIAPNTVLLSWWEILGRTNFVYFLVHTSIILFNLYRINVFRFKRWSYYLFLYPVFVQWQAVECLCEHSDYPTI